MEKTATQAKVTERERQQSTRASMVTVETAESMYTKLLTVGVKGKTKSKVTEIRENDNSKQVEETWTPTPS